ncbi:MAG: phosphoadenylyl-sulfate reductase [Bacteroidetes bacterium]|nr:phosphoadenylyl-sulfate reductase [Bacteroidota bacterium]
MENTTAEKISSITYKTSRLILADSLAWLAEEFPAKVTFSSSFSIEDQVIAHAVLSNNLSISIFTLDTGRLFAETYSVWNTTNEKYNAGIKAYYPNTSHLEDFVNKKGPNSFYESVDNRKQCCYIRKVEPLKRALAGNEIWVTGLRAEHSPERKSLRIVEWDEGNKIIKFNPLLLWTSEEVRDYINEHDVPYNSLHDRGFVSIGCAPCTRAIKAGEDFRAGRWWWEDASKKECGLHTAN